MTASTKGAAVATQHYCLTGTGTGTNGGAQFTVHTDGNIRDAMRILKEQRHVTTSHARGCTCSDPANKHFQNEVVREAVSA